MNPAKSIRPSRRALLAACLAGAAATQSYAAESEATGLLAGKLVGETPMDRAWSAATLYKNENNPILQEFSLQGMLQLQAAEVSDGGKHYSINDVRATKSTNARESYWGDDIEARRVRLGIKSKWLNVLKLDGSLDLDPNFQYGTNDPDLIHGFAKQILDLYVTYSTSDDFNLMLGKREVKFGREQEISSKEILTFERGLLSNLLYPAELTGVWVNGKGIADHWLYETGVYSNERTTGFSGFQADNGTIFMSKLGYDYSGAFGTDTAVVGVHHVFNTGPGYITGNGNGGTAGSNASARTSPKFENSFSLYNDITAGRFGLMTEALWGDGTRNQADVYGLTILPSYFIYSGLQLVGRLQVAGASRPGGLSLPGRYESIANTYNPTTIDKTGSTYEAAYLGMNYYINGHKSKLMAGVEWSRMKGTTSDSKSDYNGRTILAGYRMNF